MAYKPKSFDQIADENDFDNELNRSKNAKTALESNIAKMEADIAAGKKGVDMQRKAAMEADLADINDFLSQEPTMRPKVVTKATEAANKKSAEEAEKKKTEAEGKWDKEYTDEENRRRQAGSASSGDELATSQMTPDQRQAYDTSKTGKGISLIKDIFNRANLFGTAWMAGNTNEEMMADARGKKIFKEGGLDKTSQTYDTHQSVRNILPGGMSMSEYLRLIALGDTPTLRAKMGIPKTQADAGIAAGQTGAQAAGSDYDALVTHRQNAANHAFDMTRGGTNTPGVPAGGAGRGRVFTKNILSPTIQLGGTAVALLRNVMKNEEEAAVAADPDMSSFRPEDREFFRTKVEPIRQKLMQPKKDAAKTKADTSKKKLDASLLPVVGAGSDAYPNLSEKYLKDKWHQRFTMPGEMSANVKGVSGDDAIQALALEATTAFRAGDEAGYKKAGEITADINSRLLTMGLKPKNPILIGGINQSGPLGNIGITALVPKEDGSGFRIVVTPRSGQGYGAPVDISSTPEPALPDLASLGDDFTEESYLNAFKDEGQQALAKAIEERDSALTPTPQGRRYRPRAR